MAALEQSVVVAVVGAGAMGAGIAQVAAQAGHSVMLYDLREGAAAAARQQLLAALGKRVEKGRMGREQAAQISERLQVVEQLADLADAGLVVEAIVEDLAAKRALFAQLEALVPPRTLLATNTSSISVTTIAAGLMHPERLAGLHFFNPAPVMALVEIVSGLATSQATRQTLHATAEAWGKQPVLARSTPGFIVNRVARPFYAEGLRLLEEGVADVATLDALLREGGGFRMGPFELTDLIGQDVNAAVTRSVFDAYAHDPRFRPSLIQQELVAAGRLGRKSGQGFYDYREGAESAEAASIKPTQAPQRVRIEGNLGPAQALIGALQGAGIVCEQACGAGVIRLPGATLALTDGRSATVRAAEEDLQDLVLFDLALDYAKPGRLALGKADQADESALYVAAGLFQSLGWQVSAIDDTPALVVMRTVAMLANEGADAVMQGVASATDVDRAMRYGTNYPRGPLAWADSIGVRLVLHVLSMLQEHYGDDRYRPSALLRRHAITQRRLLDR
ncbi:3-hydroxyacyl-CoA dehydrogenase PaaH [Pseudomonas sp. NPDC089743]|uniref:3-hydroxyacyl-CoA dehydrogenase PaaH n=1 Tax=Pseudomonas sp. NPDC089743 TaxID=3364471 RepID=UPI00381FEB32